MSVADTSPGSQDTTDQSIGDWTPSHSITVPTAQPTPIRTKEDVERAVATAPTVPNETVRGPSGWAQVPVTPLQAPPGPRPQSAPSASRPNHNTSAHAPSAPGPTRAGSVPSTDRPAPRPELPGGEHPGTSPASIGSERTLATPEQLPAAPEKRSPAAIEPSRAADTGGRREGNGGRCAVEPIAPLPAPKLLGPNLAPVQRVTRGDTTATSVGQDAEVDELALLHPPKRPARHGLRKLVYTATAGSINLGPSPAEVEHDQLAARINQPMRGRHKIAFVSIKGGVGKTTVAHTVGATFASVRGDRVIAIDANPDLGTLADRVHREHEHTVRDLLADPKIRTYSDVRRYTSQGDSRLEVLASEVDPTTAEAFSESDYLDTLRILEVHYNIVLTDCGTGISHSAMHGILNQADALVVISSTARDGARSAVATLSWLNEHGYKDLVSHSMVAINSLRPGPGALDPTRLEQVFLSRGVRGVATLPYDAHLAEGGPVEMSMLAKRTTNAYLQLAASLADDFTPVIPGRS